MQFPYLQKARKSGSSMASAHSMARRQARASRHGQWQLLSDLMGLFTWQSMLLAWQSMLFTWQSMLLAWQSMLLAWQLVLFAWHSVLPALPLVRGSNGSNRMLDVLEGDPE